MEQTAASLLHNLGLLHHVQARLALGWKQIDATSDILATVTCEVLGVEEDERGLVSKLV